jgi:hypothetical protein
MQLNRVDLENQLPAPTLALLGAKAHRYIKQAGSSDSQTVSRADAQEMLGGWTTMQRNP